MASQGFDLLGIDSQFFTTRVKSLKAALRDSRRCALQRSSCVPNHLALNYPKVPLFQASGFRFETRCRLVRCITLSFESDAAVAQRIEHLTTDQKVGGSNPSRRTRQTSVFPRVFAYLGETTLVDPTRHDTLGTLCGLKSPVRQTRCEAKRSMPKLIR